ncbi:MAG: zinc-binding dehydrogenase [Actinobacteria bacterium]|nr:zinc-binding dehydrogenase [Actinomycetota bacterium]
MQALELYRSVPRYVAARVVGSRLPGLLAGPVAPLRLVTNDEPRPLGPGWTRVRPRLAGICGSDLATIAGRSSFYFSPLVSLPFVPGHEVVGEVIDDVDDLPPGTRVVLDPILACAARGLDPCSACVTGRHDRCDHITVGHVSPGLQTGYCADTGGGWSRMFVAHRSQLHPIPDELPDERAVLVEPLACAVHAAERAQVDDTADVLLVGAGTVGLFTLLALRAFTPAGRITVVAKHRRQAELARRFGATEVVSPGEVVGAVRRATRALRLDPERGGGFLLGGVDVAIDCVGSRTSLDTALRTVRSGGRVVLAGLPTEGADLTPAWFRELEIVGAYASTANPVGGLHASTFDAAVGLATDAALGDAVGATYRLPAWREAIDHALSAGSLGTIKVAFDLRDHRGEEDA